MIGFAPVNFLDTLIHPIPYGSAYVIVTIDGEPYAGFTTRSAAQKLIRLWTKRGVLPLQFLNAIVAPITCHARRA